jgi:hypothetical protein
LAAALLLTCGPASADHEVSHLPSYYPDEIRINAMDPESAGRGLADQTLHAYVGAVPKFARPLPAHVKSVKSLGSFLVLSLDPKSKPFATQADRCAAARAIFAVLGKGETPGFVSYPYPVTPFHADYLNYLDRIEATTGAVHATVPPATPVSVGARGAVAEALVKARFGTVTQGADAVLEAVPVSALVSEVNAPFNGWSGVPWYKEGWFQAYRLLAPGLDAAHRQAADEAYDRLVSGGLSGTAERVDDARELVARLTGACTRLIAGYTLREEFYNEAYPPGAENIAVDAHAGMNSAVFVRTVKLRDYPWNGKLQLGVREPMRSAWNPVAGFTDAGGRLLWSAVGDQALLPSPSNSGWLPNRVHFEVATVEGRSGGIRVPADALRPEPGSGLLRRAGDWAFASAKVTYRIGASPFDDGTEQTVADLLYPYAFLFRWGAKAAGDRAEAKAGAEPSLEASRAALETHLAGLHVVRVERTMRMIAQGFEIPITTPVLDVYLTDTPGDEEQEAALAAPWSTVPWTVLALMEEAVARGYAAFSDQEAARRGVPWLDLVRGEPLKAKLEGLVAQFEREGFRPAALTDLVSPEAARARWHALGAYAAKNGHFLVTNGPYRLKSWNSDGVVLEAVREMAYPLGFGTFDRYVKPPRAVIDTVTQDERSIVVHASADMDVKGGRSYMHVTEPLTHTAARGVDSLFVASRYLLLDGAGKVLKVDRMKWAEDGHFQIDLPALPPGDYTVMLAVFLDGNALDPSTRILHFRRIGATHSPG